MIKIWYKLNQVYRYLSTSRGNDAFVDGFKHCLDLLYINVEKTTWYNQQMIIDELTAKIRNQRLRIIEEFNYSIDEAAASCNRRIKDPVTHKEFDAIVLELKYLGATEKLHRCLELIAEVKIKSRYLKFALETAQKQTLEVSGMNAETKTVVEVREILNLTKQTTTINSLLSRISRMGLDERQTELVLKINEQAKIISGLESYITKENADIRAAKREAKTVVHHKVNDRMKELIPPKVFATIYKESIDEYNLEHPDTPYERRDKETKKNKDEDKNQDSFGTMDM